VTSSEEVIENRGAVEFSAHNDTRLRDEAVVETVEGRTGQCLAVLTAFVRRFVGVVN
jgi:hypothetical protein